MLLNVKHTVKMKYNKEGTTIPPDMKKWHNFLLHKKIRGDWVMETLG